MAPSYTPLPYQMPGQLQTLPMTFNPQFAGVPGQPYAMPGQLNMGAGGPTLTYEQWLALRGGGQAPGGVAGAPGAPGVQPNPFQASGGGLLAKLLGGGSSSTPTTGALFGSSAADQVPALPPLSVPSLGSGGADTVATAAPEAGAFDLSGIGGAGNGILPLAGAVGAYDLFKNHRTGARGIGQGAASGAALGSYFGPWGAGAGALLGGAAGALQHESTRDIQKGVTKKLLGASNDPVYQAYVRGMRGQFDSAPPDPSHPFGDSQGNKYATFDEYKNSKAGLDASNLTGVEGNLGLGAQYTSLSEPEKQALTQKFIDANLYHSSHGGVQFTNQDQANQIFKDFLSQGGSAPLLKGQQLSSMPLRIPSVQPAVTGIPRSPVGMSAPPPAQQQVMIPRSKTRSPGIDLQGRRISY